MHPLTITGLFAAAALPILSGCAHQAPVIEADFAFENVNIVPMNEEKVLVDKIVAVRDGGVVAIVDSPEASRIIAGERVDGGGAYLIPGLADMHVHLRMNPQAFFKLQLANGVTTVRNMGIDDGGGKIDHIALRDDIAAGKISGPRYLISGPQLNAERLPTPADVQPMLDMHAQNKFDTIKIHGDLAPEVYNVLIEGARRRGLSITGHAQHMQPLAQTLRMNAIEHMEEFLYVARDNAFSRAASGSMNDYLAAYYANVTRLADPAYRVALVEDVAASGVYVDPTLIVYAMIAVYLSDEQFQALQDDPRLDYLPESVRHSYLDGERNEYRAGLAPVFEDFLKNAGVSMTPAAHLEGNIELLSALMVELHDAGVPLLLGSDAFGALAPGFAVHQELELMVAAGLTPYEALRTGTTNVAAYLGEADGAGTIEVGKRADFILVADNPLEDIRNAASLRGVFSQGVWRSAADLRAMLAEAKGLIRQ